ncbi:MAG: serine protease [Bacteroidota bacterium]
MIYSLLLCLSLLFLPEKGEIVYGSIDYLEVLELKDASSPIDWYEKSRAVGVIIPMNEMIQSSEGTYQIRDFRLREEIEQLNPNHPFTNQVCVGIGTVFLVDSTRIMTAGHLVKDLRKSVIVFDYEWDCKSSSLLKKTYQQNEVFRLKKVVKRKNSRKGDYALIELDKVVTDRPFLTLEPYTSNVESLKTISSPDGTPLKLTNQGFVWKKDPRIEKLSSEGFFLHNLDNSGGSSGAPIFNAKTGQVIGIQSGGDDNYIKIGGFVYSVKGDDEGNNTNIGRPLSGEVGSKIPDL